MTSGTPIRVQRRLAAILAADVVGYSRLMGQDEAGTLARIKRLRAEVIEPRVTEHGGRVFKTTGDGFLVEFPSPVEAVECAVGIQQALRSEASREPSRALQLRIGVNLGDLIIEPDGDVFGDGVNVAARLEQIAEPGGILVSHKVYEEVRGKLFYGFEERGEQRVKNIEQPIRAFAIGGQEQPAKVDQGSAPLPLPDKPSIAVLPLTNLSSDPEQDYIGDGVVEEVIAALSRVRSFFVIARSSTSAYKHRAVTAQQVSRELGVRYILEGSIRRSRERVRITAQLIDATTGTHIWGNQYDGLVDDVFALQDEITSSVVGAIQPSIRAAEIERARRKRPDSLDAYDLVMRSLPYVWSMDEASNRIATELLEKALSLEPTYPLALSLFAWCCAQRVFYACSTDVERDRSEARAKAQAAADLAPDDPFVLTALSTAYSLTRDLPAARLMIERALALDPNLAWAWHRSGWLHNYSDDPETAITHFERSIRLSPLDPRTPMSFAGIGVAYFIAAHYDKAAQWITKGILAHPKAVHLNRVLAPAYFFSGNQREAEAAVQKLLSAYPCMTVSQVRSAQSYSRSVQDRISQGLRMAGLPE
jgi:adenylate cyclase